jgi:hypothetical protein
MPNYGCTLSGKTVWGTRTCDNDLEVIIGRQPCHSAAITVEVSTIDQVRYGHNARRIRAACFTPDHPRDGASEASRQTIRCLLETLHTLRALPYRLEVAAPGIGLATLGPVD